MTVTNKEGATTTTTTTTTAAAAAIGGRPGASGWAVETASAPETAAEIAERLRVAISAGFAQYAAVEGQLFAPLLRVAVLPPGPIPERPAWTELDKSRPSTGERAGIATLTSRLIPDVGIVGTATVRPGEVIVIDTTITGTLPDGWHLHLHTTFTCVVELGRIVQYVVQNDHAEFQRYVRTLGDPYSGRGIAALELQ